MKYLLSLIANWFRVGNSTDGAGPTPAERDRRGWEWQAARVEPSEKRAASRTPVPGAGDSLLRLCAAELRQAAGLGEDPAGSWAAAIIELRAVTERRRHAAASSEVEQMRTGLANALVRGPRVTWTELLTDVRALVTQAHSWGMRNHGERGRAERMHPYIGRLMEGTVDWHIVSGARKGTVGRHRGLCVAVSNGRRPGVVLLVEDGSHVEVPFGEVGLAGSEVGEATIALSRMASEASRG